VGAGETVLFGSRVSEQMFREWPQFCVAVFLQAGVMLKGSRPLRRYPDCRVDDGISNFYCWLLVCLNLG